MASESISWTRIEFLVKILTRKIKNTDKEFDSISTISRGGLVPARMLADQLNISKILTDKNKIPSDSLFVDDIYDSGETFKKIICKVDNPNLLVYSTFFARKGKKYPKQLIFAQKTKGSEYIVFPWDILEYNQMK